MPQQYKSKGIVQSCQEDQLDLSSKQGFLVQPAATLSSFCSCTPTPSVSCSSSVAYFLLVSTPLSSRPSSLALSMTMNINATWKPCTSERLLLVWRCKPPGEGLLPPYGYKATNVGAMGGADRRSLGFERCSFRRKGPSSREGFCIVWPANSILWLPLVNRFYVLDIEESNTSACKPIVTLLPCCNTSNPETKMEKETSEVTLY